MPTWPTNKPNSNLFDSDNDSINQSRPELKTMSDAVNDIVDFVDTTNIADNFILMYNSSNGRLEPAKFDSSTTIETDSAGGPNIVRGLGGVANPLTADLDQNYFKIGDLGTEGVNPYPNGDSHISHSFGNYVNLSSNQTSTGPQISIRNFNATQFGTSLRTGNKFTNPDYGSIQLLSVGPSQTKDDSALWVNKNASQNISSVEVEERGKGVEIRFRSQDFTVPIDSAGIDNELLQLLTLNDQGIRLSTSGGGSNWPDAHRSIHLESEKDINIRAFVADDSAGLGYSSPGDAGTVKIDGQAIQLNSNNLTLNYGVWPSTDGSNGQVLQTNGSGTLSWVNQSGGGGGGLSDVVSDTTPQLGGDLDLNGNDIVTVGNANLELAPNGSGKTIVKGNDNPGALQFNCETNAHGQVVQAQPHSAGVTNNLTLPAGSDQELVGTSATQTLTNKRLTSPKINEDVALTSTATELNLLDGITGIADEDNMSSNSNTKLATQQSIKAYVDAEVASAGGGGASGNLVAGNNISFANVDSAGQATVNLRQPFNNPIDFGDQNLSNLRFLTYGEDVNDLGTTGGTLTPDHNSGNVQKITLNNNLTLNSLSNVASGDSLTLIIQQDGTGGRTLSSTMKFAGGAKTLSTGANAIDVLTIFYDGTNYLASLSTNFS